MVIKRWNGIQEYAEDAKTASSYSGGYSDDTWAGGSFQYALDGATKGDNSLVDDAEKLLDKLDADIEITGKHWEPCMAGAYPIVAEFLAGSPNPMRRMVEVDSDNTPLAIYVSTTCSASISESTMLKRGVAILALLLKMQQLRPIELYLIAELHGTTDGACVQVIQVESKPLDISVACFTLARVAFARQLTYNMGRKLDGFDGSWPRGYRDSNWESRVREAVGMNPNDLYIPAAKEWDAMVTDPVAWVNAQVEHFMGVKDDE